MIAPAAVQKHPGNYGVRMVKLPPQPLSPPTPGDDKCVAFLLVSRDYTGISNG
jgi:hypothetical protein